MLNRKAKYAATFLAGCICAAALCIAGKVFAQHQLSAVYKILSDGFWPTGAVFILFALLKICANGGTFDMLSFALIKLFRRKNAQTFYGYRSQKCVNIEPAVRFFAVGALFLSVGIIFLCLYYNA